MFRRILFKIYCCAVSVPVAAVVVGYAALREAEPDDRWPLPRITTTPDIARLRSVVNAALAYKASMMQTISSLPIDEQDKPMQGRMTLRTEFVRACDKYEAAEAAKEGT